MQVANNNNNNYYNYNNHLRAKIIINGETLDQNNQFTYLGCSISYQFSSDVEL
jgi:hypothetical protein